jgi:hypothetical protein
LGRAFLAIKLLSKHKCVEVISYGIRQMALEEAYYWTAYSGRCACCW